MPRSFTYPSDGGCAEWAGFPDIGVGGPQRPVLCPFGVSCQSFYDTAPVVGRCKLGFRQYSFHHTHLVLTRRIVNDLDTLGLFRTCYFPSPLSELQSLPIKVSPADMSYSSKLIHSS